MPEYSIPAHFLRWERPERTNAAGRPWQYGCAFLRQAGSVWTIHDYVPENLMVLYLMTSSGTYTDADGNTGDLRPGTLMLRFPGRAHSMEFPPDEDVAIATMRIPDHTCRAMIEDGVIHPDEPLIDIGLRLSVIAHWDRMIAQVRTTPLRHLPLLAWGIQTFLVEIIVEARRDRESSPGKSRIIQKACRILQQNLQDRVKMPEIANQLGVSYAWFRKVFHAEMGQAPGEYRIARRIEKAQEMLLFPDHPPKRVAQSLGYPDVYAFSRQFKHFTGSPPARFQKRLAPAEKNNRNKNGADF